ncbi:head-tail connector protein [Pseudomonadota bacterium]|nr:head-tail connector protein [Pseudomonadota bacterium]
MGIVVTTQPSDEPITLAEAKIHLHVDHEDEDDLISKSIKVARKYIEQIINRPLITQSQTYYAECFDAEISLKANLKSVASINYIDANGVNQLLDPERYYVDTVADIGVVVPAYGSAWPSARYERNSVKIEFVAGYGLADDVPEPIGQAILLMVGDMFENRTESIIGVTVNKLNSVDSLLSTYRVLDH